MGSNPTGPTISRKISSREELIEQLIETYGFHCAWCGLALTGETLTLDHVFPYSLGGRNTLANLCLCCGPCNVERSRGFLRSDGVWDGLEIKRMELKALRFWRVPLELDPCTCFDDEAKSRCSEYMALCRRRRALRKVRESIENILLQEQRQQEAVLGSLLRRIRR